MRNERVLCREIDTDTRIDGLTFEPRVDMANEPSSLTLEAYPRMEAWYAARVRDRGAGGTPADVLLTGLCGALSAESPRDDQSDAQERGLARRWARALSTFLEVSANPSQDFLKADHFAGSMGFMMLDISSKVAEDSMTRDEPIEPLRGVLSAMANETGLAAFRFMSAWMLFNAGQVKECVEECDRCDQPYAHVLGLQGQALLELGQPADALPVLEMAIELMPHDPVPRFQAAKAALVTEKYGRAWEELRACWNMVPGTPEVAMMMGMVVARDTAGDPARLTEAWNALIPFVEQLAAHDETIACLIDIGTRRSDKDGVTRVIDAMDGATLARSADYLRRVPAHLRAFATLGWGDVTQAYLNVVTTAMI